MKRELKNLTIRCRAKPSVAAPPLTGDTAVAVEEPWYGPDIDISTVVGSVTLALSCVLAYFSGYKFDILVNCILFNKQYFVFPWQDVHDAMVSATDPIDLLFHVMLALLLAFVCSLLLFEPANRVTEFLFFILTAADGLFTANVLLNITHLGTKPVHVALAFNGIPLVIMNGALLMAILYQFKYERAPTLPWFFRHALLIYYAALMLAPAFELGYRMTYIPHHHHH